ncbi:DUF4153 domain-containing protein, partial [Sulfurovum sp. bin170]|uniref:DUF4153 domain-containing protein n=1 Tax=Sulfurovum sp. bin170 TaxID=2695268 RepID=UPI0013E08075
LSAFLLTVILISLIELEFYQKGSEIVILATKVAFVASLGVVLFPALRLLYPSFLLALIGIMILAGYYYILPSNISDSESHIFFRHTLLILSLFLMLIWAPFVSVKISNKNIWEWTQNIILALFATTILSLILYAGLSLAIYAIDRLFEIDIASRRYAQLAIMVFGLYGVNFFLSQMPKYILLVQVRTYTKVEVIFTKYILTSLAIGYFLILFAYDIKILVSMEFPKGILAWITVAFSVVAIATYLFWTPLWSEEDEKYKRYIWIAVLIQTLMLGVAIWIRIDEYGFTESRYFIALFGVWLLLMSLYFILIKSASYKWLFISLSLLIISSQFGKYSASEVSRNDQTQRLYKMIEEAKPISEKLDIETKYKISNLISYLSHSHGKESLISVIPKIVEKHNKILEDMNSTTTKEYHTVENFPRFATKELGFRFINRWEWRNYLRIGTLNHKVSIFQSVKNSESIKVDGYQWLTDFRYYRDANSRKKPMIDGNISILFVDNNLHIIDGNSSLIKMNMNSLIELLEKEEGRTTPYLQKSIVSDRMEYSYTNEKVKVKLLINNIAVLDDGNISRLNCKVLFSSKN